MRSTTMRRLLPLALLCLVAVQAVSAGRTLHAKSPAAPKKKPLKPVPTGRKQYVQFTVSIQATTCANLPNGPAAFNTAYKNAMKADLATAITALAPIGGANPGPIIATIGAPGIDCADWSYNNVSYAAVTAAVSFNGTNTTLIRDFMWDSTRDGICSGGYRQDVWINVAALMAANSLTVRLNNGSRQNPFGANMGWVKPVTLPCPAPKASPAPQVPSPSPEPAVPSPSPAPGCGAIPNSVQQPDGTCKCTNPAFAIDGKDGDKLVYCVSTTATLCPAPVSTAVKDNSTPVPKLLSCITPVTECPAPYTFPLYGQSPSTKLECRLPVTGCTYTSFTMPITDANGVLIGCVNPSSNACPFVAFRSQPSYTLDFCRQVDSCPIYSETPVSSTVYTTAGRAADRTLKACLTLASDNKCPQLVPNVNYPVEVVLGHPTSCGGAGSTCIFGNGSSPFTNTRVQECLATGAQCDPARFPLQMFNLVGAGATIPTLVGCRQARPFPGTCDFTAAAMGGNVVPPTDKDPNAASYTIEVYQTQNNLVGCVVSGSSTCPAEYPNRNVDGGVVSCYPSTDATNPCIPNGPTPVPLMDATGKWVGICVPRPTSCSTAQPGYPVSIRSGSPGGDVVQCRKQISVCPNTPVLDTDGTTAVLSTFPMYKVGADGVPVITSCYPPARVGSTCQITADGAQYFVKIQSSAAGAPLQGCLDNTATKCPAEFPFTILGSTGKVTSCAPAGDQTTCSSGIPATTSGVLVGCVANNLNCAQAGYPTTIATIIGGTPIECMTAGSVCYKPTQPFSLFELDTTGTPFLELTWCINPQESITNCNQASPAVNPAWLNAAEIYNNAGTSIVGCAKRPNPANKDTLTICPIEFSFIFKDIDGATFQCRQGINQTTCAAAVAGASFPPTIGDYTVDVKDAAGATVGCTVVGGDSCPEGGIIVAETATSPAEKCILGPVTSCAGFAGRTFPIYSGRDGSDAVLIRCIAPVDAFDCSGSASSPYTVPMYATSDGTGKVIGCVDPDTTERTPCPSTAPFYLLGANGSPLKACLQARDDCSIATAAWAPYTIKLTNSGNTVTLGCMLPPSTSCPSTAALSPYTVPFVIRDAIGNVVRCELQSLNPVTSCAGFSPPANLVPIIGSPSVPGATGPVIGCQVAGNPADPAAPGVYPNGCPPPNSIAIYANDLSLVACMPSTTTCAQPYEAQLWDPAFTVVGCWDADGVRRRSLLAVVNSGLSNGCGLNTQFAMWGTSRSGVFGCLNMARYNNTPTTCTNSTLLPIAGTPMANFTNELYYKADNTSTLEGCQIDSVTTCPKTMASPNSPYKYFISTTNPQVLQACSELFSCPTDSIPVYSTSVANASSPIGCVTPAGNNSVNPCPTWDGTPYTFFTADASGVVTGCYLNSGASNTCPPNMVALQVETGNSVGCIPGGITECNSSTIIAGGGPYTFEFWRATNASDATPVLGKCVQAANITNNCAAYSGFEVPLKSSYPLRSNPENYPNSLLDGCVAQGASTGARCPASHPFPLLNTSNLVIIACYASLDSSSCLIDYPDYNVPLCIDTVQQATIPVNSVHPYKQCATNATRGCIRYVDIYNMGDVDNGNSYYTGNTTTINMALSRCYDASSRGYPTAESYKLWVASLQGGSVGSSDYGDLEYIQGCYLSSGPNPTNLCAPGTAGNQEYTRRVVLSSNTNALQGCTDSDTSTCVQFVNQAGSSASWTCQPQL